MMSQTDAWPSFSIAEVRAAQGADVDRIPTDAVRIAVVRASSDDVLSARDGSSGEVCIVVQYKHK
jgi:hypothetical protein